MKLVISIEGGIVQNVHAGFEDTESVEDVEVVIVDYDIDSVPENELVTWEFEGTQRARVFDYPVDLDDKAWVEKAFALAG